MTIREDSESFEATLINLLNLIGRLADSDDKRLTCGIITHDMQNIQVELDTGDDIGKGNCHVYFMESDGAAIRLSTQGADSGNSYRSFSIAADALNSDVADAIRSVLPKIVTRAGRDTTRNMGVTLAMFEEKP